MNIVECLQIIASDFEPISKPLTIPAKNTVAIGGLEIPLYGELLGLEKVFLDQQAAFKERLTQDLILVLKAIQEKTQHGDLELGEGLSRLINAIKNKGNYILREKSQVTEFDSSLIEKYDEVVATFNPDKRYTADCSYDLENGEVATELRSLVSANYKSWVNVGVQGDTFLELVVSIYLKKNLINTGSDVLINILPTLKEVVDDKLNKDLAAYEYFCSDNFIIYLLAYTRLANNTEFIKYSLVSEIENALEQIEKEFIIPDKKTKNKSNPSKPEDDIVNNSGQTKEK